MRGKLAVLLMMAGLAGCASGRIETCPAPLQPMAAAELYFGLSIPGGGSVSADDWQRFLDEEVTPRFPDGLTVTDANGQWKGADGIAREQSKRLFVLVPGSSPDGVKLEAIRSAYRARFRQESVLRVDTPVCGAF